MILRWLVALIIIWLFCIAIIVSLHAQPLNATAIVCNPVLVPGIPKETKVHKV